MAVKILMYEPQHFNKIAEATGRSVAEVERIAEADRQLNQIRFIYLETITGRAIEEDVEVNIAVEDFTDFKALHEKIIENFERTATPDEA